MAKIETYRCDGCGALKQEANHWWAVSVNKNMPFVLVQPINQKASMVFLTEPVDYAREIEAFIDADTFHLCGQDCVNRKLAEVMKP